MLPHLQHQQAFEAFKPLCIVLVTNPNRRTLDELQKLCDESEVKTMESLQEYLMFPMQLYLKQPRLPENYTLAVLQFIARFYLRSRLSIFFILKDVLNALLRLVSSPQDGRAEKSEDLKLNILECATAMLQAADSTVIGEFYTEATRPAIGQLVYLTLIWLEAEQSPPLKTACFGLMRTLLERGMEVEKEPEVTSSSFHQLLIDLLPGILSRLARVALDPALLQSSIKAAALETWGAYVTALTGNGSEVGLLPDSRPHAHREICAQYNRLGGLAGHSDARVRRALLTTVEGIISMTSLLHLEAGLTATLNSLVVLALDEIPAISGVATALLDNLIAQSLTQVITNEVDNELYAASVIETTPLVVALSTEANRQLFKLSRQLGEQLLLLEADGQSLQHTLLLLTGYLQLIRNLEALDSPTSKAPVNTFFLSRVHLRSLLQNLVRVSEFSSESSSVMSIPSVHSGVAEDSVEFLFSPELYLTAHSRPVKTFRYLATSRQVHLVGKIAALLGAAHLFAVADYLLQGIAELDHYQREAIFILNEALKGVTWCDADSRGHQAAFETLPTILDSYLGIKTRGANLIMPPNNTAKVAASGEWTADLLLIEGLGIICRQLGLRLGNSIIEQVIVHAATHTTLEDRLSAHVLYFCLCDIAAGQQVQRRANDSLQQLRTDDSLQQLRAENSLQQLQTDDSLQQPRTDDGIQQLRTDNGLQQLRTDNSWRQQLQDGPELQRLLIRHVDQLAKDLNLLLRRRQGPGPGAHTLLRIVVRVCPMKNEADNRSSQLLPDLLDTMESLVNHLAATHTSQMDILGLLSSVKIFVFAFRDIVVRRQLTDFPASQSEKTDREDDTVGMIARLVAAWEEERRTEAELLAAEPVDDGDERAECDEGQDEEQKERILTVEEKFLQLVIHNVRHYISLAGQPAWQMAALDSATCCLGLLGESSRADVLLPLVHQTWLPLKLLFKSSNIFLVDKAFDCLLVIARHARDFVRKRVVTEVFPPLLRFFHTLEICVKDRKATLMAMQSRRILIKLVDGIWDFLELLDLHPLEADPVIELLVQHMGSQLTQGDRQHRDLTSFFRPKRNVDANILDLKLNYR